MHPYTIVIERMVRSEESTLLHFGSHWQKLPTWRVGAALREGCAADCSTKTWSSYVEVLLMFMCKRKPYLLAIAGLKATTYDSLCHVPCVPPQQASFKVNYLGAWLTSPDPLPARACSPPQAEPSLTRHVGTYWCNDTSRRNGGSSTFTGDEHKLAKTAAKFVVRH